MNEVIEAIRRRREAAMAAHNEFMTLLDDLETMALQAAALREPPVVVLAEPELTWNDIWQAHPAAADFFAQFPGGIPEDRLAS